MLDKARSILALEGHNQALNIKAKVAISTSMSRIWLLTHITGSWNCNKTPKPAPFIFHYNAGNQETC